MPQDNSACSAKDGGGKFIAPDGLGICRVLGRSALPWIGNFENLVRFVNGRHLGSRVGRRIAVRMITQCKPAICALDFIRGRVGFDLKNVVMLSCHHSPPKYPARYASRTEMEPFRASSTAWSASVTMPDS